MKTFRGVLYAFLLILAGVLSGCASTGTGLVLDRDYARVEPAQPVPAGEQIAVVELFWYGCPHCFDMHPRLKAWSDRQLPDVALSYQPVIARPKWEGGARLHFALESLGEAERLAGAAFEAAQLDGLDFNDEAALLGWAERQGLERQRFAAALHSPAVERRTEEARNVGERYQLRGVPSLVVDGKYLTANRFSGSADQTLAILDRLVQRAREERAQQRR